jgi:PPM family protein phosphatase
MMHIESCGRTDIGKVRAGNEDALLVDDARSLYVVADGMGGHAAGEVASATIIEVFSQVFKNAPTGRDACDTPLSPAAHRLVACIREANRVVFEKSGTEAACRGMGTTVAAVCFDGPMLIAANVGDSPIYVVRDEEVELISVVHTVAAEQSARDPERAGILPARMQHMLSRAVGVEAQVEADVCEMPCRRDDRIILCSDGLSNLVAPEEMARMVSRASPQSACRDLVECANQRGGTDNITVIVLRIAQADAQDGPVKRLCRALRRR